MNRKRNETLTAREFATRSGLGLQYIYIKIWSGKIPARKVDGRWLIPAAALEERKRAAAEAVA
jgi:excisionase family DNA binding protein